ncbi:MAG: M14 family metallocarboxypeptidase [Pseudomonadota bacterium]
MNEHASNRFYPIGTPGQPWGDEERRAWLDRQVRHRSYAAEVEARIDALRDDFDVVDYGELTYGEDRYVLHALRSGDWSADHPTVLITGGVHGYETSGVQGALDFARTEAARFADRVNLLIAPCVSPWGYERIHRWNPDAVDPNRSFRPDSPSGEAAALMALVAGLDAEPLVHMDLHETTDTDATEFRPALAARDGKPYEPDGIPDGFYTVGDSNRPELGFQKAIIDAVSRVTHIAPADENGEIIGCKVVAPGIILYDCKPLGLCAGMTSARFTTTTEVYPDSGRATSEQCNAAQVAAVRGGLEFALGQA